MKPRKHAELIKAWADGAEIEIWSCNDWWHEAEPTWNPKDKYRIKPEEKKPFTHKELSDEEICGIAGKLSIATTEIENDWAFCVVEFARAIIKASRGEE